MKIGSCIVITQLAGNPALAMEKWISLQSMHVIYFCAW